ncbi:MAG: FMN-dependent NADH-azoreductase, partial [Proteobacteria bacterium]
MKLLHLDSSALGTGSVTRELTGAIVARWQDKLPNLEVEYRDLDVDPLPHLTGRSLAQADAAESADAARTMDQFLAADVLVIGAPMYNFSIPSTLKAWIDRVAVAGKTFRYTENG